MNAFATTSGVLSGVASAAGGAGRVVEVAGRAAERLAGLDPAQVATWYGWGRAGIGAAMVAAPALTMGGVVGSAEADRPPARTLSVMLGVREVALGVALARAVARGDGAAVRRLTVLCLACDATDAAVGLRNLVGGRLPRRGAALMVLAAGGGVATAAHVLYRLR